MRYRSTLPGRVDTHSALGVGENGVGE